MPRLSDPITFYIHSHGVDVIHGSLVIGQISLQSCGRPIFRGACGHTAAAINPLLQTGQSTEQWGEIFRSYFTRPA